MSTGARVVVQHFKMLLMSPIFVLAARLMIQLPANALGEAVSEGTIAWALPTMWEMQMEFLDPGFGLSHRWLL